jgi:hypothetical protein
MGAGPEDLKSVRILNRIVTYTENGIEYEADQRHAEIIGKQMGLVTGSKGVATPGIKTKFTEGADELRELPPPEASKYRGLVARANYLGQDRSDIKFSVKELSRRMAKPRYRDVENLKRLARYLIGRPRMITLFGRQDKPAGIVGWSDSDWAGCMETRKSTSGGLLCIGNHTIKCWSVTQAVLALSSGEAEFYALVKTASQGLGLRAMLDDLAVGMRLRVIDKKIRIKTDASAARGMALRKGLGPVRHIEVGQLWIQDKIYSGEIGIEKIGGKTNLADTLTKYSDTGSLDVHIAGVNLQLRTGRHYEAPDVAGDEVLEKINWQREDNQDEHGVDSGELCNLRNQNNPTISSRDRRLCNPGLPPGYFSPRDCRHCKTGLPTGCFGSRDVGINIQDPRRVGFYKPG